LDISKNLIKISQHNLLDGALVDEPTRYYDNI